MTFQVSRYLFNVRFSFSKELSITRIHEITNYVFDIFSDWPKAFIKFIEEFRSIPKAQKTSSGLKKEFGEFYTLFYKQLEGIEYHEIRKQFELYLIKKWDGGFLSDRFINKFLVEDTKVFLSGDEAVKEFGISNSNLIVLIKTNRIDGMIIPGKINNQILIRKDSLERYRNEQNQYLSLAGASTILGITKRLTRILIYNNIISVSSGLEISNDKLWAISKESVEGLITVFMTNIIKIDRFSKHEVVGFNGIIKLFPGIRIVNFIRSAIDKKIKTIKIGKSRGLNEFSFLKKDVYAILGKRESFSVIYTHDISRIFNVIQDTVFEWINAGLLVAEKIEGVYILKPMELEKFKNNYISLTQISNRQGNNDKEYHKATIKGLMKYNVFPVYDYRNNYLFSLFKKEEANKFLDNLKKEVYFTFEEVSVKLKMGLGNIYNLVKRGYLLEKRLYRCRLIHIADIEDFQFNYVWISKLSNLLELPDSIIYKYLKKNDVQPCQMDFNNPYIYEKEKIYNCLINNPIQEKLINLEDLEHFHLD